MPPSCISLLVCCAATCRVLCRAVACHVSYHHMLLAVSLFIIMPHIMLPVVLQVEEEEIKSAYRRLAMQYHPDRHLTKDAATRAAAEQQFAQLLKAYDTLKDPEQRALYNAGHLVEATLSM